MLSHPNKVTAALMKTPCGRRKVTACGGAVGALALTLSLTLIGVGGGGWSGTAVRGCIPSRYAGYVLRTHEREPPARPALARPAIAHTTGIDYRRRARLTRPFRSSRMEPALSLSLLSESPPRPFGPPPPFWRQISALEGRLANVKCFLALRVLRQT